MFKSCEKDNLIPSLSPLVRVWRDHNLACRHGAVAGCWGRSGPGVLARLVAGVGLHLCHGGERTEHTAGGAHSSLRWA